MPQESTPVPGPPPEEKASKLPFYAEALEQMRVAAVETRAAHPEIRSVLVIFDYIGGLNDSKIPKTVMITTEPDMATLLGTLNNLTHAMAWLVTKVNETQQKLRQEVVDTSKNLKELLEQKHAETEKASTGLSVPPEQWPDKIWRTASAIRKLDGEVLFDRANFNDKHLAQFGYEPDPEFESTEGRNHYFVRRNHPAAT